MWGRRLTPEPAHRPDVAGDGLLHPAALLALVLLVVNDHVLKAAFPGAVTGKLSDLAGLAWFPVLLVGGWELALAAGRRWRGPSMPASAVAVVVTAVGFGLVKTVPAAALAFGWALGLAQWLLALPVRAVVGSPSSPIVAATVVVDPTDLLALPALGIALWIGWSRSRARSRALGRRAATAPGRDGEAVMAAEARA